MRESAASKFIGALKKRQRPLEKYVFPVLLLLWPLAAVREGICLSDPAYSLSNYEYLTPDYPWYFATLTANGLGKLLMKISGGGLLPMNVLTGLLVSCTALLCYFILQRLIPGWMVFLGEMTAVSLCWCPTVILYNYLGYFLLTLGCLFLFLGVLDTRKKLYFVLAGLCLGANVTVRIANAVQAALILAVWFYFAVRPGRRGGKKQNTAECLKATGLCILGYAAGFLVPVLCSMVFHGPAYFAAIPGILSMTSGSAGYGMGAMLRDILNAYVSAGKWTFMMLGAAFAGMILFLLPVTRRFRLPALALYLMGAAVMIRFFYGRGMFTVNYQDYWCMFSWGMQFVILTWLTALPGLAGAAGISAEERFLCALSLLLVVLLPLGSNNYTFPVLNCLFVTAPVTLWMLRRYAAALTLREKARTGRAGACTAFFAMALVIVLMTLLQGGLFHVCFAFRDGTDGTARSAQVGAGGERTAGMHTTPENAARLETLLDVLAENTDEKSTGIFFGNLPGVHYFARIRPALETTWPDLDSYPTAWMEERLQAISQGNGSLPVVVMSTQETGYAEDEMKRELLSDFMTAHHYQTIYEGQDLVIRRAPKFNEDQ